MATTPVGVLDLVAVEPGRAKADAIEATLDLAVLADRLGYRRYWLAEHHEPSIGLAAPEILVGILAGLTERIRVGTAGVLLRFYSPAKVAEVFRLLASLYPGRIDLGFGKGGAPGELSRALLDGRPDVADDWAARAGELIRLARNNRAALELSPVPAIPPQLWTLGTGSGGAMLAAREGTAFAASLFHARFAPAPEPGVADAYRRDYRPSPLEPEPRVILAMAGACAETDAEARAMLARYPAFATPSFSGDPARCRDRILELAHAWRADEVVLVDLGLGLDERKRHLELLAGALSITA